MIHPVIQELVMERRAWQLDQEEFAERIGMSRTSMCNFERGLGHPSLLTLSEWADALGFEVVLRRKSI